MSVIIWSGIYVQMNEKGKGQLIIDKMTISGLKFIIVMKQFLVLVMKVQK